MSQHKNLIAGEWTAGGHQTANINPSNTNDVIGEYARADISQAHNAIAAAQQKAKSTNEHGDLESLQPTRPGLAISQLGQACSLCLRRGVEELGNPC